MKARFVSVGFMVMALGLAYEAHDANAQKISLAKMKKSAPQPRSMAARFAHLPTAVPVSAEGGTNIDRLRQLASERKDCGLTEVAPGVIVKLDCKDYTRVSKSVSHLGAAKLRLVKSRKLYTYGKFSSVVAQKARTHGHLSGGDTVEPNTDIKAGGINEGGGGAQASEDFPDAVDHRTLGLEGPIKDQKEVGACTAFALSTTIDNALRRAGRSDTVSPSHVWAGYGMPNMQTAGDANIGRGIATYDTWGYSSKEACRLARHPGEQCDEYLGVPKNSWTSDPKLLASLKKSDSSGVVKLSAVEELQTGPASPDEIMAILASGADIWSAFYIDGSKWRNSAMSNAVIPDWSRATGGHAVTISGYRKAPSGRQYLIHNSWGTSWGDKGYAWISENMLIKNLKFAYRIKLEGQDVKPEELTDDDCAWDELIDSGTGQCGKICSDDSRPNNGCPSIESKNRK